MQRSPSSAELASQAEVHATDILILEHFLNQIIKICLSKNNSRESIEYSMIVSSTMNLISPVFSNFPSRTLGNS